MKTRFAAWAAALFLTVGIPAFSQQQSAQQQSAQAQKGPHPKSQKELEALQKVIAAQQAKNWDGEIQAINGVLENFADTEYKPMLLNMAMEASQNKGDYAQTVAFGDQALQADPNNLQAKVLLAETIASHTRENDLDKDQSIKKATDYATQSLDQLKSAAAPPAGIQEAMWPEFKKELTSRAYDALGQASNVQKKYPDAITNYKAAIDAQPTNSVAVARLAQAYVGAKQFDDAISTADKVLAMNEAPGVVKQFAQQQKDAATKLKAAGTGTK
jgi:tetratricopeptide (TPR) repeat protein